MPGFAFNLAIITVVGQCVGAGDKRAVQYYTGKLMRMCYGFLVVLNIVLFAILPLMLDLYSISDEAREIAVILIWIHNGFGVLLWTPSFVLPNAMKATGDAKFVMVTAVLSMFIFRVALSYVLGIRFGMGAVGVWICMVIDWICRIICFTVRFEKKIGFRLKQEYHKSIIINERKNNMKPYGKKVWLVPDTYLNSVSKNENLSHEAICVINTSDVDAEIKMTLFFEDREARTDFSSFCPAMKTHHIRMDKLRNANGEQIPRDTPYAVLLESNTPIVCQYSRLDTSAPEMALMTTIAYAVED